MTSGVHLTVTDQSEIEAAMAAVSGNVRAQF